MVDPRDRCRGGEEQFSLEKQSRGRTPRKRTPAAGPESDKGGPQNRKGTTWGLRELR